MILLHDRVLTAPARPERRYGVRVLASTRRSVTIAATVSTAIPGTLGMFVRGGGHITVHGSPRVDGDQVTWTVTQGTPPPAGAHVAWTGIVASTPQAAGLKHQDQLFPAPSGMLPTWVIGDMGAGVYAIHIHGLGSSRAGMLRGVAAASKAGLSSVVPAYRNTLEGPTVGRGRSNLGSPRRRTSSRSWTG